MLTFKWFAQTMMFVLVLVCLDVLGTEDQRFKVITTFTVIADIVQNVAGDAAVVESITKPNAEIHNYQTTPGDIRRAQGANLIIYNGFNLELWFDRFFHNLTDVPKVVVTEGIEPIGIRSGPTCVDVGA
jgi:manganese/iron transport system substrate-binding protein